MLQVWQIPVLRIFQDNEWVSSICLVKDLLLGIWTTASLTVIKFLESFAALTHVFSVNLGYLELLMLGPSELWNTIYHNYFLLLQ
jgi:hypothetical protein